MDTVFKGVTISLLVICIVLIGYALLGQSRDARDLAAVAERLGKLEDDSAALGTDVTRARSAIRKLEGVVQRQGQDLRKAAAEAEAASAAVVELDEAVKGITDAVRNSVRGELDRLKARQDGMEAYWARKGELLPPLPPERLTEGYTLAWAGDEFMSIEPVDGAVAMLPDGGVLLTGGSYLRSTAPATQLTKALAESGDFSVEVLLKAGNLTQGGPARIVSISRDPGTRNFTLGQQGEEIRVRLRTTETDLQGLPPLVVPNVLNGERQHLIFVRRGETHALYADGQLLGSTERGGDLSNWDLSMPLMVGNEATSDRDWQGEVYGVTFFSRALSEEEARKWFEPADPPEPEPTEAEPAEPGPAVPEPVEPPPVEPPFIEPPPVEPPAVEPEPAPELPDQ